jgi:catechol 2,3-dioxygenase-like lactoylglutathione lyase family enzyme
MFVYWNTRDYRKGFAPQLRGLIRRFAAHAPDRLAAVRLDLSTLVVRDYDEAIAFFTDVLGFELASDEPATTNDGRPKRWVVVRPPGGGSGLLLARADGPEQERAVGNQAAGRVTFFLHVDDFEASYERLVAAGVDLVGSVRQEPYGTLQVFRDLYGNAWDLIGPARP